MGAGAKPRDCKMRHTQVRYNFYDSPYQNNMFQEVAWSEINTASL